MAIVRLLGEQVNLERTVDERTAFAIGEILAERDYQDQKWAKQLAAAPEGATREECSRACLEVDRRWSGTDWVGFMERYQDAVKPDMADPETRKALIKVAALALAALRAS